ALVQEPIHRAEALLFGRVSAMHIVRGRHLPPPKNDAEVRNHTPAVDEGWSLSAWARWMLGTTILFKRPWCLRWCLRPSLAAAGAAFLAAITRVEPGLIRVEADEVTYDFRCRFLRLDY